ncbi:hypothetical protein TWF173_010258 [Orbilia oligospora]|nr:hypothetical protein TWF173_010258 [Orbilia oligospora]
METFHEAAVIDETPGFLKKYKVRQYRFDGRRVLCCLKCERIKLPNDMYGHLKSEGHEYKVEMMTKDGLKHYFKNVEEGWATYDDLKKYQDELRKLQPRPFPNVSLDSGWKCRFCLHVYLSKSSFRSHRSPRCPEDPRTEDEGSENPRTSDSDRVSCQSLYSAKGTWYFQVYPAEDISLETQDEDIKELLRIQEDRITIGGHVKDDIPVPFLDRVLWRHFCNGDNEFIGTTLSPLTGLVGRNVTVKRVDKAITQLLTSSLAYVERTSVPFRRKLRAPHDEIGTKPFTLKQVGDTHTVYFNQMKRMVVYLFSLYLSEDDVKSKCGINLAPYVPQLDAVKNLARLSEDNVDDLAMAVLDLVIVVLSTKLPAETLTRFKNPVMSFLAVMGYDEISKVWRTAAGVTTQYAAMSFTSRLLVLRYVWRTVELPYDGNKDEVFGAAFDKIIVVTKDKGDYAMGEWLSQHAYAKKVSDNTLITGRLIWAKSGLGLYYAGEYFDIALYRRFIRSLEEILERLVRKLMMLGESDELVLVLPQNLFDNPTERKRGHSCVNDPRNAKFFNPSALLEKIRNDPELRRKWYPEGTTLSHPESTSYLEQNHETLKWLAVIMLLTSGEPARGTELMSYQKFNTPDNLRSFIVSEDDVMIMATYNKTQAVTGMVSAICRFLTGRVAALFLTYLFVVDPFVDFLKEHTGLGVVDSLLFCDNKGKAWDTGIVSNFLKEQALKAIGFPLKVASYRQIIAGISRQYIQDMAAIIQRKVKEEEDFVAKQFGHVVRTHEAYYGQDTTRSLEVDERAISEYRRVTAHFQYFIGAISELPKWVLTPSAVWFDVGNHPKFHHPAFPSHHVLDSPVGPNQGPQTARQIQPPQQPVQTGQGLPLPVTQYYSSDQPFPRALHRELVKQFQGDPPKRVGWKLAEQADAARAIYSNNVSPLLVVLPCAAGKTAAALIAIAAGTGISIIVEPYISTCKDVEARAKEMGISTTYWVPEMGHEGEDFSVTAPGVIITTPESACGKYFAGQVANLTRDRRLDRIIVDEIHQPLLDEGFRDVAKLSRLTTFEVPIVMLTATLPPMMVSNIRQFFNFQSFYEIRAPTNIKHIVYSVHTNKSIRETEGYLAIWKDEVIGGPDPLNNKILVYCRSAVQAQGFSRSLSSPRYNGDMSVEERELSLREWNEKGGLLMATTCLGPGVDTKGVKMVVHVGMPYSLLELCQQAARAGRDGSTAYNQVFCSKVTFDVSNYRNRTLWRQEAQKALNDFVTTSGCRRRIMSKFMDGKSVDCMTLDAEPCDNCREDGGQADDVIFEASLVRLDAKMAREGQAQRIMDYLTLSRRSCAYCLFLKGSPSGHQIPKCPHYRRAPLPKFPNTVCTFCGIQKSRCIQAEIGRCTNDSSVAATLRAVFDDAEIRSLVYGEAGIREFGLESWDAFMGWCEEGYTIEGKSYCNVWRVLQTVEELRFLTIGKL